MEKNREIQENEMQQVSGGTSLEYLTLTSLIASIDPGVSDTIKDPANRDYTLYWILSHTPEISEVTFAADGANTAVDQNGNRLSHDELIALLRKKYNK